MVMLRRRLAPSSASRRHKASSCRNLLRDRERRGADSGALDEISSVHGGEVYASRRPHVVSALYFARMTNREFFMERWRIERPVTLKVLRALPEDRIDYKAHEKSKSAAEIAWIFPEELRGLSDIIEAGEASWESRPKPKTLGEITTVYEDQADRFTSLLESTDEAKWESQGKFLYKGPVVFAGPVREHCWWILFDQIHHRGQLSTYIRPMGGKVPSIYGGSADEKPSSS